MNLLNYLTYSLDEDYCNNEAIIAYESHLTYLRNISTLVSFEQNLTVKYVGDFYGLLIEIGYPANYHYCIMRVNKMTSPTQYDGSKNYFYLPPFDEIEKIIGSIITKKE